VLLARELDRLDAVLRLRADLEPGSLEQLAEVEPDDRLVFGYEDADAASLSAPLLRQPRHHVGAQAAGAHGRVACHQRPRFVPRRGEEAQSPQRLVLLVSKRPRDEQPVLAQRAEMLEVFLL
jgi:hypothetical protein